MCWGWKIIIQKKGLDIYGLEKRNSDYANTETSHDVFQSMATQFEAVIYYQSTHHTDLWGLMPKRVGSKYIQNQTPKWSPWASWLQIQTPSHSKSSALFKQRILFKNSWILYAHKAHLLIMHNVYYVHFVHIIPNADNCVDNAQTI